MLKNILNTDADKRFTIEQIRAHPWYQQCQEIKYSGIVVGQDQIPIDEKLHAQLSQYDFDLDYS